MPVWININNKQLQATNQNLKLIFINLILNTTIIRRKYGLCLHFFNRWVTYRKEIKKFKITVIISLSFIWFFIIVTLLLVFMISTLNAIPCTLSKTPLCAQEDSNTWNKKTFGNVCLLRIYNEQNPTDSKYTRF